MHRDDLPRDGVAHMRLPHDRAAVLAHPVVTHGVRHAQVVDVEAPGAAGHRVAPHRLREDVRGDQHAAASRAQRPARLVLLLEASKLKPT